MSQELFYTSAPRGLRPASKGFCTVAATAGMPPPLAERLELLSGYRPLFPVGDPRSADNPVLWAHWRISIGGRTSSVLSHVSFAGADYTGRSNKFAHHLVLDSSEQPAGGPAWVMLQPGVMETQWSGEPRIIPAGRAAPAGDSPKKACEAWAAITGDAGWGGVLSESFMSNPSQPGYIIFEPGTDLLPLMNESLSLLRPSMRWQVTFSTYFTDLPSGLTCHWRCCAAGTPAAKEATRVTREDQIIDLTSIRTRARESAYVVAARTGKAATFDSSRSTEAAGIKRNGGDLSFEVEEPIPPSRQSRRLLTAQKTSDSRDVQSWMPPLGATVVEVEEPPRRGSQAVFWVIAIVWPILVGAFVLAVFYRGNNVMTTAFPRAQATTSSATSVAASPTTSKTSDVPAIQAATTESVEHPSLPAATSTSPITLETPVRGSAEKNVQPKTSATSTAPTTSEVHATATASTTKSSTHESAPEHSPMPSHTDATVAPAFIDFDAIERPHIGKPADPFTIPTKADSKASLQITLLAPAPDLAVISHTDGSWAITRKSVGGRDIEILKVWLRGAELKLQWMTEEIDETITRAVKCSLISLKGDNEQIFTGLKPISIEFKLSSEKLELPALPKTGASSLRIGTNADDRFKMSGPSIKFEDTECEFTISINKSAQRLESDWIREHRKAENKVSKAKDAEKAAARDLPKVSNTETVDGSEQVRRGRQGQYLTWEKAASASRDAEEMSSMLDSIKPTELVVFLGEKVTLYRITVTVK